MSVDLSAFRGEKAFGAFRSEDWDVLSRVLIPTPMRSGCEVFREGDAGNCMYLIASDRVRILRKVSADGGRTQEQVLAVLEKGQVFGEMALLDGGRRSAYAEAVGGAQLLRLTLAAFEKLKVEHPSTALKLQDVLVSTLCARLRAANKGFEIVRFWLA